VPDPEDAPPATTDQTDAAIVAMVGLTQGGHAAARRTLAKNPKISHVDLARAVAKASWGNRAGGAKVPDGPRVEARGTFLTVGDRELSPAKWAERVRALYGPGEPPAPAQTKPTEPGIPHGDRTGFPHIGTGMVLRTKSGRLTSPAPAVNLKNNTTTAHSRARMHHWLLEEGRKEVTPGSFQAKILKGLKADNLSPSDVHDLNELLFGDELGAKPGDVVTPEKPGTTPKNPVSRPEWDAANAELPPGYSLHPEAEGGHLVVHLKLPNGGMFSPWAKKSKDEQIAAATNYAKQHAASAPAPPAKPLGQAATIESPHLPQSEGVSPLKLPGLLEKHPLDWKASKRPASVAADSYQADLGDGRKAVFNFVGGTWLGEIRDAKGSRVAYEPTVQKTVGGIKPSLDWLDAELAKRDKPVAPKAPEKAPKEPETGAKPPIVTPEPETPSEPVGKPGPRNETGTDLAQTDYLAAGLEFEHPDHPGPRYRVKSIFASPSVGEVTANLEWLNPPTDEKHPAYYHPRGFFLSGQDNIERITGKPVDPAIVAEAKRYEAELRETPEGVKKLELARKIDRKSQLANFARRAGQVPAAAGELNQTPSPAPGEGVSPPKPVFDVAAGEAGALAVRERQQALLDGTAPPVQWPELPSLDTIWREPDAVTSIDDGIPPELREEALGLVREGRRRLGAMGYRDVGEVNGGTARTFGPAAEIKKAMSQLGGQLSRLAKRTHANLHGFKGTRAVTDQEVQAELAEARATIENLRQALALDQPAPAPTPEPVSTSPPVLDTAGRASGAGGSAQVARRRQGPDHPGRQRGQVRDPDPRREHGVDAGDPRSPRLPRAAGGGRALVDAARPDRRPGSRGAPHRARPRARAPDRASQDRRQGLRPARPGQPGTFLRQAAR
jgi:hypothetical protein